DRRLTATVSGPGGIAAAVDRDRVERHGDRRPRVASSRGDDLESEDDRAFCRLPGGRHARTTARGRRTRDQAARPYVSRGRTHRADRLDVGARRRRRDPALAVRVRTPAAHDVSRARRSRRSQGARREAGGRAPLAGAHCRAPRARRAACVIYATNRMDERRFLLERVGEAAVVQVYADGFGDLPLREKTLVWHLAQAAIAGRDIFYDQRYAHNLEMRDVVEAIVSRAHAIDPGTFAEIDRYTKLFWINTGPYNN